jgi:hypothetical protein
LKKLTLEGKRKLGTGVPNLHSFFSTLFFLGSKKQKKKQYLRFYRKAKSIMIFGYEVPRRCQLLCTKIRSLDLSQLQKFPLETPLEECEWFEVEFTFKSINFSADYLLSGCALFIKNEEDWKEFARIVLEAFIFHPIRKYSTEEGKSKYVQYGSREERMSAFHVKINQLQHVIRCIERKADQMLIDRKLQIKHLDECFSDIYLDLANPSLQKIFNAKLITMRPNWQIPKIQKTVNLPTHQSQTNF